LKNIDKWSEKKSLTPTLFTKQYTNCSSRMFISPQKQHFINTWQWDEQKVRKKLQMKTEKNKINRLSVSWKIHFDISCASIGDRVEKNIHWTWTKKIIREGWKQIFAISRLWHQININFCWNFSKGNIAKLVFVYMKVWNSCA